MGELVALRYVTRERGGRQTLYQVALHLPLRPPFKEFVDLAPLLAIVPTGEKSDR